VGKRNAWVLQVLDRLQEDDRFRWRTEAFDQVALEAEVLASVAKPCVLVRLRIRVDADHACGGAREHVGAVALATGHVDHAQATHAPRDPLIDHEVAPEPVVLLWDVRQRALAGERQRWHAVWLVCLDIGRR
jgi:hypothetical protein